jgi:hypothetical protein
MAASTFRGICRASGATATATPTTSNAHGPRLPGRVDVTTPTATRAPPAARNSHGALDSGTGPAGMASARA